MAADSVAVQMPNRITASTTDGEHAERHHRGDQLLQDLELLAVHAPEVDEEQRAPASAASPQNHA